MIHALIEGALRSLIFALIAEIGVRALRIGDVVAQSTALGLTLVRPQTTGRLCLLSPKSRDGFSTHPMTLLEELQARIQAKSGSGSQSRPIASAITPANPPQTEKSYGPPTDSADAPGVKVPGPSINQPAPAHSEPITDSPRAGGEMRPVPQPKRVASSPPIVESLRLFVGRKLASSLWKDKVAIGTGAVRAIGALIARHSASVRF